MKSATVGIASNSAPPGPQGPSDDRAMRHGIFSSPPTITAAHRITV
jgi:hypothetical protein